MICLCNNWSVFRLGSRIEAGSKTGFNNKFVIGILGHMTKMAATPIYGKKKLQKSSSPEPQNQFPQNLVCSIWDSSSS